MFTAIRNLFSPVLVCTVMFCANCSERNVCEVCESGYIQNPNGDCVEEATTSESGDIGRLIGTCAGFPLSIDCLTCVYSTVSIYTTVYLFTSLYCIVGKIRGRKLSQISRFCGYFERFFHKFWGHSIF